MIGPARLHPARSLTGAGVYGLLDRRFRHLSLVYDERFAHTYGPWRAVVPAVVDRFLACHAKRLARWTLWGSRLRRYCLYRRALIGNLARLAARIVTAGVRATTGESDLRVGIIACLQTHGSLAKGHPHLHLVVVDGGFRPDGTFVRWPGWPAYDSAALSEAFRRAVLRLFVRRG